MLLALKPGPHEHLDERRPLWAMVPTRHLDRFWSKVEKTPTCWLWTGHRKPDGYGQFNCPRPALAHRWIWIALHGPLVPVTKVTHLCRVRHCVNPEHLQPVSPRTIALRGCGPSALNAQKTHCVNGHEFTPQNTIVRSDNGGRRCRTCRAATEMARPVRPNGDRPALRRALIAGAQADPGVTLNNLRSQYGDDCFYCSVPMIFAQFRKSEARPPEMATIEHVHPISRGGTHTWDNVVLACWSCNSSKGRSTPLEWSPKK